MTYLRKPSLYPDTSVPSGFYDDERPARQQATRRFWARLSGYRPNVSALVLAELLDTPEHKLRESLIELVSGIPKLRVTAEARELASLYVDDGVVPEQFQDDAVHLAIATVQTIDYLESWNFEHMVNVRVRRELNALNAKCGYRTLEIVSPPEL